jgi:hypothetical protein
MEKLLPERRFWIGQDRTDLTEVEPMVYAITRERRIPATAGAPDRKREF